MKASEQLKKEFIEKLDIPGKDKFFAEIGIDYIILAVKSEQIEECYQNFQKNIKSAFGGEKWNSKSLLSDIKNHILQDRNFITQITAFLLKITGN